MHASDHPPGCTACLQGLVEQYQRQYMEACWAPLVSLLQADLRQPAPGAGQLEKGGRQAAKDKWTAVNKLLEPVLAQQVGGRVGRWHGLLTDG